MIDNMSSALFIVQKATMEALYSGIKRLSELKSAFIISMKYGSLRIVEVGVSATFLSLSALLC